MRTLNRTYSMKKSEISKGWILIDATDMVVGRLASRIAHILKGKHKPAYTPHMDCGDNVVVINAEKVVFSGKKEKNKIYYRHTGYPGGIKSTTPKLTRDRGFPERILFMAVKRMLAAGPLGRSCINSLYIYNGPEHKQEAQQPKLLDLASQNSKNVRR